MWVNVREREGLEGIDDDGNGEWQGTGYQLSTAGS